MNWIGIFTKCADLIEQIINVKFNHEVDFEKPTEYTKEKSKTSSKTFLCCEFLPSIKNYLVEFEIDDIMYNQQTFSR